MLLLLLFFACLLNCSHNNSSYRSFPLFLPVCVCAMCTPSRNFLRLIENMKNHNIWAKSWSMVSQSGFFYLFTKIRTGGNDNFFFGSHFNSIIFCCSAQMKRISQMIDFPATYSGASFRNKLKKKTTKIFQCLKNKWFNISDPMLKSFNGFDVTRRDAYL